MLNRLRLPPTHVKKILLLCQKEKTANHLFFKVLLEVARLHPFAVWSLGAILPCRCLEVSREPCREIGEKLVIVAVQTYQIEAALAGLV